MREARSERDWCPERAWSRNRWTEEAHLLHSVLGPCGPERRSGVSHVPQSVHTKARASFRSLALGPMCWGQLAASAHHRMRPSWPLHASALKSAGGDCGFCGGDNSITKQKLCIRESDGSAVAQRRFVGGGEGVGRRQSQSMEWLCPHPGGESVPDIAEKIARPDAAVSRCRPIGDGLIRASSCPIGTRSRLRRLSLGKELCRRLPPER